MYVSHTFRKGASRPHSGYWLLTISYKYGPPMVKRFFTHEAAMTMKDFVRKLPTVVDTQVHWEYAS